MEKVKGSSRKKRQEIEKMSIERVKTSGGGLNLLYLCWSGAVGQLRLVNLSRCILDWPADWPTARWVAAVYSCCSPRASICGGARKSAAAGAVTCADTGEYIRPRLGV